MAPVSPLHEETELVVLDRLVEADFGGAGVALPQSTATSHIVLWNNSHWTLQYRIGAAAWVNLGRHRNIRIDVDLSVVQVLLRRGEFAAAVQAKIECHLIPGACWMDDSDHLMLDVEGLEGGASSTGAAQTVTPADGATIQIQDDAVNGFLRIKGSTPLATLNIVHPANANSVDSQVRSVYFEVDVAAINWPGSSATNLPTNAVNGDSVTTQRLEPGLWSRRY